MSVLLPMVMLRRSRANGAGSAARRLLARYAGATFVVLGVVLLSATFATAQDHEAAPQETGEPAAAEHVVEQHAADEHGDAHTGPSWADYAYKWINFALLLGLMYKLLVVPPAFVRDNFEFEGLKVLLAGRVGGIGSAKQLAEDQQQAAATTQAASATRLEKVDDEVAAMLAEAQEAARAERQRIEISAASDAEQIRALAARDMDSQIVRARRDLRRHVANLSVSIATGLVKDSFSGGDQERLVRKYLDRLGETVA